MRQQHRRDNRPTRRLVLGGIAAAAASVGLAAQPADAQVAPSTPWLPLDPVKPLTRIAFGSCLQQRQPQPIWSQVLAAKPDLFVMTGDNVYGDVSDGTMKELIAAYQTLAKHPDFASARAELPFLATWDDHDYGLNDASASFPHKAAARTLFAEFWGLDAKLLPPEGIYRAHVIGPPGERVQVILLDLRTFRSEFSRRSKVEQAASLFNGPYVPDASPEKTMLGPAQWAWLEAQLKVPAEVRLIVSSTQLLAAGHHWERWGHLPREQARFFDLLKHTAAKGVLVLSGDRHRAQFYKRTEGFDYPLYDITSSALNIAVAGREPDDQGRLGIMLSEDNFGLIRFDWNARWIYVELKRLSGIPVTALALPFELLGVKREEK